MIDLLPSRPLRHLARLHLKYARRPRRYSRLIAAAERRAPDNILEIGVYTGQRGVETIEAARLGGGGHTYHGFDLFDLMDDDILSAELSKRPDNIGNVEARLQRTRAEIHLHKGWSQETLSAFRAAMPDYRADMVFIDGGHAVETIRADWDNVVPLLASDSAVLFDDYYVDCPHLTDKFGCNSLIESLDPALWQVTIHPEVDRFVHGGKPHNVAIVEVVRSRG